jgi:hypothetical protein
VLPTWEAANAALEEALPLISEWNHRLVLDNMREAASRLDSLQEVIAEAPSGTNAVRQNLVSAQNAVKVVQRVLEHQPIPRNHAVFARLRELERQLTP